MAILAATVLSQAVTSGFEWLYPLRFAAAFLILWIFRAEYRKLNWRFGWLGPAAGAFVFLLWLGIAHLGGRSSHDSTLAVELGQLPSPQRIGWLIVRCLAAVTTVPIAEELAFRGFVARRVMAADFERVSYLTPLAIAVSAVTFGLLHGRMWIAGILAGIVFAVVAKTRGRIGDAMAAHATANLLLVAWAIASSDYSIW
jgi:exosortase E/protease (VPEID-CTERM system)